MTELRFSTVLVFNIDIFHPQRGNREPAAGRRRSSMLEAT
jgi:hypothetical protein